MIEPCLLFICIVSEAPLAWLQQSPSRSQGTEVSLSHCLLPAEVSPICPWSHGFCPQSLRKERHQPIYRTWLHAPWVVEWKEASLQILCTKVLQLVFKSWTIKPKITLDYLHPTVHTVLEKKDRQSEHHTVRLKVLLKDWHLAVQCTEEFADNRNSKIYTRAIFKAWKS